MINHGMLNQKSLISIPIRKIITSVALAQAAVSSRAGVGVNRLQSKKKIKIYTKHTQKKLHSKFTETCDLSSHFQLEFLKNF